MCTLTHSSGTIRQGEVELLIVTIPFTRPVVFRETDSAIDAFHILEVDRLNTFAVPG